MPPYRKFGTWYYKVGNSEEFKPFQILQSELSVVQGCILRGNRVVVPPAGQARIIEELHESQPGICRMKNLARSYFWWPHINNQLEEKVRSCNACQQARPSNVPEMIHPWEWPTNPWSRLHLDYAGHVDGKWYLVLIEPTPSGWKSRWSIRQLQK